MKILHFSHTGTPDIRIERYAYMQKKDDHEIYLCGEKSSRIAQRFNDLHIFDQFFTNPASIFVKSGIFPFHAQYKKHFTKIHNQLQPDIVHAHDVIAAKVCSDLNIKFIYDDHEYWSKQIRHRIIPKFHHKLTNRRFIPLYERWEADVLSKASAVISVSETQADEHSRRSPNVITLPNFPTQYEIEHIAPLNQSETTLNVVNITKVISQNNLDLISSLQNLIIKQQVVLTIIGKIEKGNPYVNFKGSFPHMQLMKELPLYHVGLLTFPPSRELSDYFKYSSPNRVYIYAHCGVTPIIHNKMKFLKSIFGPFAKTVNSASEIPSMVEELAQDTDWLCEQPSKIQEKARNDFVWDKHYTKVKKIYNQI